MSENFFQRAAKTTFKISILDKRFLFPHIGQDMDIDRSPSLNRSPLRMGRNDRYFDMISHLHGVTKLVIF
jgi:hypothetical protein